MTTEKKLERGEVLVAILKDSSDLDILQERKWYRVPVDKAPRRWPPKWLAFYQGKEFGDEQYAVNYYGRVSKIQIARRHELFPEEPPSVKSEREYYQVWLDSVERLARPIRSNRPRRIVFVPTTWQKFSAAGEINDLFDDSRLEDELWAELKLNEVDAERQWKVEVRQEFYQLDFAVFCVQGKIDVEVDGDQWHHSPERAPRDNERNNAVESIGWQVLRFSGGQIHESMREYCVPQIAHSIRFLGGLSHEGLILSKYANLPEGKAVQLGLFEDSDDYLLD